MTVRPSTLTEKMAISTMSGTRMRRSTRKMEADPRAAEAAAARTGARRGRRSSSRRSNWMRKWSSGLLTATLPSAAVEADRLDHEQHDGDDVGQQRAARQRDDARRPGLVHADGGDVGRVAEHQRRADELQVGDQAGGQVDGPDLGPVTELQDSGD